MLSFQFLSRASAAILILLLYLHLGTNNAQNNQDTIEMEFSFPETVDAGEEVTAKLNLKTQLKECMVVKTRLNNPYPMDTSFTLRQTVCLCNDYPRNLYWDFIAERTMYIEAHADAVAEVGICPENKAVVPIVGQHNVVFKKLTVIDDEQSCSMPSSGLSSTAT
ncbi:prolactin-inducible protein homolog [Sorex fumeus]|uniref:prolactin-inducible protein homolog n=1 Tax=Sorex fumeus TaxID=62283 RepID=UPI0024ADDAA1|nr:prolactin-inducible protein homolog [Sorex fumeus]